MTRMTSQARRDVLAAIADLTIKHGYPPTIREIADAVGYSSSQTAHCAVEALYARGYITMRRRCARSIVLTKYGRRLLATEEDAA